MLAIFLGGTVLWKDIERRYTYSVLSLPFTRSSYLLGRFCGTALFLLLAALVLGGVAIIVVWLVAAGTPPDRPVVWINLVCLAVLFDAVKHILSGRHSRALCYGEQFILFTGIWHNLNLPCRQFFPAGVRLCQFRQGKRPFTTHTQSASMLYYLLPNFSAFDLKINAIYGLPLDSWGNLAVNRLCFHLWWYCPCPGRDDLCPEGNEVDGRPEEQSFKNKLFTPFICLALLSAPT